MGKQRLKLYDFKKPPGVDFFFEINSFEKMPRAVLSKFPHRHSFYEILYVKEGKGIMLSRYHSSIKTQKR